MNNLLIKIKNLSKHYSIQNSPFKKKRIIKALDDVSIDIYENEILSLVGESDSGKSTLSYLLVNMKKQSGGKILYKNKNIFLFNKNETIKYRQNIQIIFKDSFSSLNKNYNIGKILYEALELNKKISKEDIQNSVKKIIEEVGLSNNIYYKYPYEISNEEILQVIIARAFIIKPKLIIFDDPISNLDLTIQARIINLILYLQKKYSMSYLYISYDLNIVNYISNRIIIIKDGKIIEQNSVEELLNNPQEQYTKNLYKAVPKIKYKLKNSY